MSMELIQGSVICRLFLALWGSLQLAWADSRVGNACRSFGHSLARTVRSSRFCQLLWREGSVVASWPGSLTQRGLTALLDLPGAICRWIYDRAQNLWEGSICFRSLSALGRSPHLLLGCGMLLMLIAPHERWNNLYALLLAMGLYALFCFGSATRRELHVEVETAGPWFALFMVCVCYAFVVSLSWGDSARFMGFYLAAFLFCLLAVSSIRSYEQLQTVVVLVVAGMTVAALYGCYQGVVGVEVVANQQDMTVNAGMPGRVYSLFDNPNNFAELLVMVMPLSYALFLNARSWKGRCGALFALAACGLALAFTYSRSGWLGIVLATVVFIAFWNWRLIPVLIAGGLCCIPLLPESIYNRILTIGNTKDSSTSYRFAIYQASGVLMKDYWFRGVGLGSDVLNATFKYYPPMFDGNYPLHTHNNYLQVWAEMGLVSGVTFLAMLFHQLKKAVKSFVSGTDRRVKNLLAAAVSGFCGILLISLAEYTWYYARNMFVYFFLFGLIVACCHLAGKKRMPEG